MNTKLCSLLYQSIVLQLLSSTVTTTPRDKEEAAVGAVATQIIDQKKICMYHILISPFHIIEIILEIIRRKQKTLEVGEGFPSMHEALGSILTPQKIKTKRKERIQKL